MVTAEGIEPAFEITHLMLFQLGNKLFVNIDHRIFGCFRVFKVLQAKAVNKIHIPLVEDGKYIQIPIRPVLVYQLSIRIIVLFFFTDECQMKQLKREVREKYFLSWFVVIVKVNASGL